MKRYVNAFLVVVLASMFYYKKMDGGDVVGLTASSCKQSGSGRVAITKSEFDAITVTMKAVEDASAAIVAEAEQAEKDTVLDALSTSTGIAVKELKKLF